VSGAGNFCHALRCAFVEGDERHTPGQHTLFGTPTKCIYTIKYMYYYVHFVGIIKT